MRKVATEEELDALPVNSLVIDGQGDVYRKDGAGDWMDLDGQYLFGDSDYQRVSSSETLLWQGEPGTNPAAYVILDLSETYKLVES